MASNTINWSKTALIQFKAAIDHIMEDSVQNAEKVRLRILLKLDKSIESPHSHPKDKYKSDNDGTYRAFETDHYRITYRIVKTGIKVIRLRHTSMIPKLH